VGLSEGNLDLAFDREHRLRLRLPKDLERKVDLSGLVLGDHHRRDRKALAVVDIAIGNLEMDVERSGGGHLDGQLRPRELRSELEGRVVEDSLAPDAGAAVQ